MSIKRPQSRFLIAIIGATVMAFTTTAVLAQTSNPGRGEGRQSGTQIVKPPQRVPVERPPQQSNQPIQSGHPNPSWNQTQQSHQHWNRNPGHNTKPDPYTAPNHYPVNRDPWALPWGIPQYPGPHATLPQPGTYPPPGYYSPYGPGWWNQGPMSPGNYYNPHGGLHQPYADQPRPNTSFPTFQNY